MWNYFYRWMPLFQEKLTVSALGRIVDCVMGSSSGCLTWKYPSRWAAWFISWAQTALKGLNLFNGSFGFVKVRRWNCLVKPSWLHCLDSSGSGCLWGHKQRCIKKEKNGKENGAWRKSAASGKWRRPTWRRLRINRHEKGKRDIFREGECGTLGRFVERYSDMERFVWIWKEVLKHESVDDQ